MANLSSPLTLRSGATLKNRFVLAPLTNLQSHPDGVLSDDEFRWLTKRAEGGFALTMTCAASVQESGVGFPGQLGFHDDKHLPGLTRLATAIKVKGSQAVAQLHHGGLRAMTKPKAPSADEKLKAEAMTLDEIRESRDCFIAAAKRAERAGFDGVELHGAHGYLICSFAATTRTAAIPSAARFSSTNALMAFAPRQSLASLWACAFRPSAGGSTCWKSATSPSALCAKPG